MSEQLRATKLLYVLFWNWSNKDRQNLVAQAPNEDIKEDLNYVFEKLDCLNENDIKKIGCLSNALRSVFFMDLNTDSAEYVVRFAIEKNPEMFQ